MLVAYNIPGRDCGGLSAGGALTTADYKAWIDGFAAGIGRRRAVVIVEPDGLGLIPSSCNGGAGEPGFSDAARFEEINYAVDALEAKPYLWVKIPGESGGQCTRGTAGPADPEWGITDPAAGQWFPQQALQLAQLASPPLLG